MRIGTKSVLFGAHCFFIHPWFVAAAWWRLYGFPWDPRLWVAFFVHDLGYVGKPNMDGPEGESHVFFGAGLMNRWFDPEPAMDRMGNVLQGGATPWFDLCLYHSRFWAKRHGESFSRLCVADKLAVALEPWWLYLPRVVASGEIKEYMEACRSAALGMDRLPGSKYSGEPQCTERSEVEGLSPRRAWHRVMTNYCRKWALTHADGVKDDWTQEPAKAVAYSDVHVSEDDGEID